MGLRKGCKKSYSLDNECLRGLRTWLKRKFLKIVTSLGGEATAGQGSG